MLVDTLAVLHRVVSTIARRVQSYLIPSYLTARKERAGVEPPPPSAAQPRAERYPEIDLVKGIALIEVLLIHAGPLDGTALHAYVINRAVQCLLVLFGASSELWWARRVDRDPLESWWTFCRARYTRLLPPVWAMLAAWWAIGMLLAPQRSPGWPWPIAHAFGYIPQVGMGWFVTLIVQLVVLFPLLRFAVARWGSIAVLGLSLLINALCQLHAFDIIDWMRAALFDSAPVSGFYVFYYTWIFAPKSFWPVVAGIVLARHRMRWPVGWSLAALCLSIAGSIVHTRVLTESLVANVIMSALDVPCAMLLLDLSRQFARFRIADGLAWIGKASWGMYLAQLLIHTTVPLVWLSFDQAPRSERWLYFVALSIGSVIVVNLGRRALTIAADRGRFVAGLLRGRWSLIVTIVMLTGFWYPALALGKVLVHGDSALVGLPLLRLLSGALRGRNSLLWVSRVAGGHPLFAEGQGGFADPLNLFAAALFEPTYALGFVHWLSMLVGAAGVFTLCRLLEIRAWLATFASISVVFSSAWILDQHNLPISATIAWAPWLMVGVEHWLKGPSIARAARMSLPAACMVLGGYPLITYGTVIYCAVSLLAQALLRSNRQFFASNWRAIAVSGTASALLALALSAIQLLPLLELIPLSHRSGGTALTYGGFTPTSSIYRGLFYFYIGSDPSAANIPILGNMLVAVLAGLTLFMQMPPRVLGHVFGTFVVFNIGMATASPLFQFVYDYHLLPGLHSYRIMHPLFAVTVIGLSVIAAFVLDRLATDCAVLWPVLEKRRVTAAIGFASYVLICLVVFRALYVSALSWISCVSLPLFALGYVLLAWRKQRAWLPIFAVFVLSVEVIPLRLNEFAFFDRGVLEPPDMIQAVLSDPGLQDYRVLSTTGADGMTFIAPTDPGLAPAYARMLKSLGSFPGLQWDVPALDGILALPLARWAAVYPLAQAEILAAGVPGHLRLMDILGIRYVSMNSPTTVEDLSLVSQDGPLGLSIYRNGAARPRLQIYSHAMFVEDVHDALKTLTTAREPLLVLERAYSGETPQAARRETCENWKRDQVRIRVASASATRYSVSADAPCDAWLFLADANYPGWRASVNGVTQPVFTAQILGKAVHLNAGHNDVVINYVPRSFYLGAAITCMGVLIVLAIGVWSWRSRRTSRVRETVNRP